MAIIAHLDLDAFFASCEKIRNPELEDRPVVVCVYSGRGKDSGAVSAADYEAREHGIHAGMPISQARSIASDLEEDVAFLGADKEYYAEISRRIMETVEEFAGEVEKASVDEAYADLSGLQGYDEAESRARELKAAIEDKEGVTASVGIGPNKLVAKMASDRDKPDGLTVIQPGEVDGFLEGLPVDDLHGVGPKTAEELERMGVETIDELQKVERQRLVREFGENKGVSLYRKSRGEGMERLEEEEAKQLSRLTTLEENTRDTGEVEPVMEALAEDVMERVESRGWRYSTVTSLMITTDMEMRTRSRSFKTSQDSGEKLLETALELVEEFLEENPDTVLRRVGVRVSGFDKGGQRTLGDF